MTINKYYSLGKNKLFGINRSITGQGVRKTLSIIKKEFKLLKIKQVKCGTRVFDWKIPKEWNVKKAYIEDKNKKKIIDIRNNNLHLISYSIPIKKTLNKQEILKHLHSIKKKPSAIPYITSYYKKYWGFCVSENYKKRFKKIYKNKDKFKVVIDSSFNSNGNLNYGELVLKGKSKKEILISTYICHPSMANNELSGPIVSMALIKYFKKKKLNKTLRFLFVPETIGSITYINKNLKSLKSNVIGGYNLSCIGDEKKHSCMLTKYGNTISDYALIDAYKKLKLKFTKYSFLKRGSDERQFNSPGVDLPIASIFRSKYGEYKEYHTSLDNFKLVTIKGLTGGYKVAKTSIENLLKKIIPKNILLCEPQMSKRDLYPTLSNFFSINKHHEFSRSVMDFLQYSDGTNDLKKISNIIGVSFERVNKIYILLKKHKLVI